MGTEFSRNTRGSEEEAKRGEPADWVIRFLIIDHEMSGIKKTRALRVENNKLAEAVSMGKLTKEQAKEIKEDVKVLKEWGGYPRIMQEIESSSGGVPGDGRTAVVWLRNRMDGR